MANESEAQDTMMETAEVYAKMWTDDPTYAKALSGRVDWTRAQFVNSGGYKVDKETFVTKVEDFEKILAHSGKTDIYSLTEEDFINYRKANVTETITDNAMDKGASVASTTNMTGTSGWGQVGLLFSGIFEAVKYAIKNSDEEKAEEESENTGKEDYAEYNKIRSNSEYYKLGGEALKKVNNFLSGNNI
jgi:hypothetical protein